MDRKNTLGDSLKKLQRMDEPVCIIVEASEESFEKFRIEEGKRARSNLYPTHKDSPHFQGDEIHGHADVPGGFQVAWTITGKRRHPNKFPSVVPKGAKEAVAKILGVDPDILESFEAVDSEGKRVFVFIERAKQTKAGKLLGELRKLTYGPSG